MQKKPLIVGSIIAGVILIFCSFTNVIGYQTVKSTPVNVSPLFSVRTERVIDQESNEIILSNFLGKEKPIGFPFPERDNKTMILLNIIDRINKMSDKEYVQFIDIVVNKLKTNGENPNEKIQKVVTELRLLRTNPKEIIQYFSKENSLYYTQNCLLSTGSSWQPGCYLNLLISLILDTITFIYWVTHPTTMPCCGHSTFS